MSPGQAALDLYDDADLRYSGYFYQTETGYAHGLSWPLLVKYYGNRNLIEQGEDEKGKFYKVYYENEE